MKKVVWRAGYMKNRGWAIGLFLESDELLKTEPMGRQKIGHSDKKKRESLIDSYQYPVEMSKYNDYSTIGSPFHGA